MVMLWYGKKVIEESKTAIGAPAKRSHGLNLPYFLLNFFNSIILK